MTAQEFITEARAVGLTFSHNGDKLAVDAEPGSLTDDVRRWLRDERETILAAVDAAQTCPPRQPARAG